MGLAESSDGTTFRLGPEHKMLLRMRDTLYEGSWVDFRRDLAARLNSEPHVFEIVPTSPEMRSTIENHLRLIDAMEAWELAHDKTLTLEPDER
jgi:hypothetical protein